MANYCGSARSNYFKVKDVEAFKAWAATISSIGVWEKGEMFAIYSDCPDGGGWPSSKWGKVANEDGEVSEDFVDLDLSAELAEHLTEDSIAVLMETGHEKLRYLVGHAIAVNHKGEYESLNIDSIYELAEKRFGIKPTQAEG